eukprot:4770912-Amphidinium_carterae.1
MPSRAFDGNASRESLAQSRFCYTPTTLTETLQAVLLCLHGDIDVSVGSLHKSIGLASRRAPALPYSLAICFGRAELMASAAFNTAWEKRTAPSGTTVSCKRPPRDSCTQRHRNIAL